MLNGKSTHSIALYAREQPDWSAHVLSYLTCRGFSVVDLPPLSGVAQKLPDIVIATSFSDSQRIASILDSQPSPRPLVLLITNESLAETSYADMVLPPSANLIEHTLRLHYQNRHLQRQVTELKQRVQEQERLSDEITLLKNAIVRNVSHELKTPLLHVKSAVALIAEDVDNQELVRYAKNATGRLEAVVKNITQLGSSLDINPGPVIVRDAVDATRRDLARSWRHPDAQERVEFDIQPNLPPILADKQGLATVLHLLIDNALKFSTDKIQVSACRIRHVVEFCVVDHGIGIASDQMDSIFETFYQIDSSTTRQYGGTGVGLALVRLILDHHQTRPRVESEVGKGSKFSFVLPVVEI